MDFSNLKRTLNRVLEMGNKTKKNMYLKFNDSEKRTPLINFDNPMAIYSSTQPLTPVSAVMESISDTDDLQLQDRCRVLHEILGPTVHELTIQQLIQNYNSIEAALNGFLDNMQNYQTSSSSA
jgi:hypothetical protein